MLLASAAVAGMPLSANCCSVSPCTLPAAAALAKICPTASMSPPATAAASATAFNERVMSSPRCTPAAANADATFAAASIPNAVPLTAFRALSIADATWLVSMCSALSFCCAASTFSALSQPPLAAIAASPPPTAVTAPKPILPTVLRAPPTLPAMVLPHPPARLSTVVPVVVSSLSSLAEKPAALGSTCT